MRDIPLEVKMLVIHELSPTLRIFPARQVGDVDAAYFRDLRAVCLVWPDTIAIIRKILFEKISLRPNDHNIDASLRNLCRALENDPNLPTFIRTLEFSHQGIDEESLFIPTASRPLFLSFLSYIPKMHELEFLRLDKMHLHEETSTEFINDLGVLKESSVEKLILSNNTFSISTFNALFDHWDDLELPEVIIDAIALMPPGTNDMLHRMLLDLDEDTWDWDDEDTWTEWGVDKPRTASSCHVVILDLVFSRGPVSGMLGLMDLLASHAWSPFKTVDVLEITVDDSSCSAMTATFVIRLNNLIRRYDLSYLNLSSFADFEDAVGTPLYLAGLKVGHVRFDLIGPDEDLFDWYVESLVAVPPGSRLRVFYLELHELAPLKEEDLGPQGVWKQLDAALSGENLQLDKLAIHVYPLKSPPNGARTVGLAQLRTWLMEICFPQVTAKYFRCMQEEREGRDISALKFWIGGKQVDAWKH